MIRPVKQTNIISPIGTGLSTFRGNVCRQGGISSCFDIALAAGLITTMVLQDAQWLKLILFILD